MRNINEENKAAAPLAPRRKNEENPTPASDLSPRPKDEENPRPDDKETIEEENQIRSNDAHSTIEKKRNKQPDFSSAKSAKVSHVLSASIASIGIVLVVASVFFISKDFFKTKPTFEVTSASYVDNDSENGIAYNVEVSKNPDKVPLLLKMAYVDEFGREKDTASVDITDVKTYAGVLPALKYAEVNYTLKVVRTDHNSETVLWSNSATFSRVKESKFYGFFWECHCTDTTGAAAGKAYYQLQFVDDFAKWDTYQVNLVKTTDATIRYSFACEAPYHDQHLVETITKEGGTYTATIVATPPGGGTAETVYRKQVQI